MSAWPAFATVKVRFFYHIAKMVTLFLCIFKNKSADDARLAKKAYLCTTISVKMYSEDKKKLANRNAFLIIGSLEATWAPMVPYVKRGFELNEAQLGMLLLCTGLGSVMALPLAGLVCKRYGAKNTIYVNGVAMVTALALVASNINLWLTALMLVLFGICTVQIDVAANVNGITLEETYKKNLMSGFHGGYSLGTLLGAGFMSILLTVGLGILPAALVVLFCTMAYFYGGCKALCYTHPREP